jgi:hypothetical protein
MSVDPASLVVEGGVLATLAGAVTSAITFAVTAFSYIQGFVIFALYATKFILQIFYSLFSAVFTVFLITFQGCFGNLFYNSEELMDQLKDEHYTEDPILRPRKEGSNTLNFLLDVGDRLRTIIGNFVTTIWALLTALPGNFVIGIVLFLISITIIPFSSLIFITIDRIYYFYCLYLNAIAYGLNQYETFSQDIGPLVNDAIDALFSIARVVFSFVCAGPVSSATFSERCPLIDLTNIILNTTIGFFLEVLEKLWTLFVTILVELGNILCPDGVCAKDLCLKITGHPTCFWSLENPAFIFQFFYYTVTETFFASVYTVYLFYAFFSECCYIFVYAFGFIIRPFITKETYKLMNTFTRYLVTVSSVKIPNIKSTDYLNDLKLFEISVLTGIRVVSYAISNTIGTSFSFADSLFCNVLLGGRHCAVWKVCSIIPGVTRTTCDALFDPGKCSDTCDYCYYKPFGLSIKSVIFDVARDQAIRAYKNSTSLPLEQRLPYIDDSGYFFTPCNLANNCCNPKYSILSLVFTVIGSAP